MVPEGCRHGPHKIYKKELFISFLPENKELCELQKNIYGGRPLHSLPIMFLLEGGKRRGEGVVFAVVKFQWVVAK
jgi:hypothetical protein